MLLASEITLLTEVSDWVSHVGFPVALLLLIGVFFWRIVVWFRPHAELLIARHVQFTTTVEENTKEVTKLQGDTLRLLQKNENISHSHSRALGYLGDAIVEAAPDEKKPAVRVNVQKAQDSLANNGGQI